eukprot:2775865-Amphidinium_carterae.1
MQRALGLLGTKSVLLEVAADVQSKVAEAGLQLPLIVKPTSSCASDGLVLCHTLDEVAEACQRDLTALDVFDRPIKQVVVQEYLQGEEFVVNTVSLNGQHRVLDMWQAMKRRDGQNIFYGHQVLVPDSEQHADVVEFCMRVLDAVELRGGAAHIEVVRTATAVKLIEINPRAAGHLPRATRQIGEDQ